MAMKMTGEIVLAQSRAVVWAALNDVNVVKACITGCQELERVEPHVMKAKVKVGIGPVSANFVGTVRFLNVDEPNSFTLAGKGEGGVAGFAEGMANVVLTESESGETVMRYDVKTTVGGKLAQLGGRLIDGVAKRYADAFFVTLVNELNQARAA